MTHLACTGWLLPAGLALLAEPPGPADSRGAGIAVMAAFVCSQGASWALWQGRRKLAPYLGMQALLLVAGVAGVLALAGMARAEVPWVVEVGDRIRPLLVALPAAMALLHVLEMASRPKQAEGVYLFLNSLWAIPGGERTYSRTLDSPCAGASVVLERWGEHHMGAEHTVVVLDRSVDGITEFQSTNGDAKFDERRPLLVIHDEGLALVVHYDGTRSAAHHLPPQGQSISNVFFRAEGLLVHTRLHGSVDSGGGGPKREREEYLVPFEELSPGLGPASDGRMPSVWPPREGARFAMGPLAGARRG